jgi:tRNA nucleotidyltransferase (CCA-adding enzyme)
MSIPIITFNFFTPFFCLLCSAHYYYIDQVEGGAQLDKEADEVISKLEQAGFAAYKVGGYIRDKLLGNPVDDIDIATAAKPEEVMGLFERTLPIGLQHGTVKVYWKHNWFEVTTFRKESNYTNCRHPDVVEFIQDIGPDLARRDFTINAMAMDRRGRVIDPFGGRQDLAQRIIRTVGDPYLRFQEDPLRILRAVRFAAKLSFGIETNTFSAMTTLGWLLQRISRERIRDELNKIIMGESPIGGLKLLAFPGVFALDPWDVICRRAYEHPDNGDITYYTGEAYRWAFLLAFAPSTVDLTDLMKALRLPKSLIQQVIIVHHIMQQAPDGELSGKRLLLAYGLSAVLRGVHLRCLLYPQKNIPKAAELVRWDTELRIRTREELAIKGNDLLQIFRKKPGPWIQKTLAHLLEQVALGRLDNTQMQLVVEARKVNDQ